MATHRVIHLIFLGEFCTEGNKIIVAKDLGCVQHVSFNNSNELISLCVGDEVWVIEIEVGIMHAWHKGRLFHI